MPAARCLLLAHSSLLREAPFLGIKVKLVNAVLLSAQSVEGAFAIVKAARREDLGIIKERKICSEKKSSKIKEIFTFKHIVKIIKEQIFTGLLIIFTVI